MEKGNALLTPAEKQLQYSKAITQWLTKMAVMRGADADPRVLSIYAEALVSIPEDILRPALVKLGMAQRKEGELAFPCMGDVLAACGVQPTDARSELERRAHEAWIHLRRVIKQHADQDPHGQWFMRPRGTVYAPEGGPVPLTAREKHCIRIVGLGRIMSSLGDDSEHWVQRDYEEAWKLYRENESELDELGDGKKFFEMLGEGAKTLTSRKL
jgi:hypothetical protein